jgi:3-methyl-2-oxobutanoate hydroxymethyltransferase
MSAHATIKRITVTDIRARKRAEKIVVLTAYTAPVAEVLDAHVDILLVGDSLGMVVYGMETTLPVTLDMMIAHGRAVVNASSRAMVVVDLPFGSYQASPAQAFDASARILAETGCAAVKLEGGAEMAETIAFLTERGIPVMAHVGLKPQHVQSLGGYRVQGKDSDSRARVIADAKAVQDAGAFSVVIEATVEPVAREVTELLSIPTIGIGASVGCDGQVLVVDDMLGITEKPPRFVKQYANMRSALEAAVKAYAAEVRSGAFPAGEHVVTLPPQ